MNRAGQLCVLILCAVVLAACGTYQGIPSHGGGMRFTEEQRLLSSSMSRAVGKLDLSSCKGKRVQLIVQSMETSGGGWSEPAGLTSLGVRTETDDYSVEVESELKPAYKPAPVRTSKDVVYLQAVVSMKARTDGVALVKEQPDVELHILVDVLGTNRSTSDYLLVVKDKLRASCELTYYLIDTRSREVLAEPVQVRGAVEYIESRILFSTYSKVTYKYD
ncbi:hypothetical protein ACFLQY_00635 [Verrucomicrobiota bacterium]